MTNREIGEFGDLQIWRLANRFEMLRFMNAYLKNPYWMNPIAPICFIFANLEICKSGDYEIWRLANLEIGKSPEWQANLEIGRSV